jgi:hypothetical protein
MTRAARFLPDSGEARLVALKIVRNGKKRKNLLKRIFCFNRLILKTLWMNGYQRPKFFSGDVACLSLGDGFENCFFRRGEGLACDAGGGEEFRGFRFVNGLDEDAAADAGDEVLNVGEAGEVGHGIAVGFLGLLGGEVFGFASGDALVVGVSPDIEAKLDGFIAGGLVDGFE